MKNILITGAGGQLGTVVTNYFLNKGYNVIAAVHSDDDVRRWQGHANILAEKLDLTNEEETGRFIDRIWKDHGQIEAALLLAGGFAMGGISETNAGAIKKQMDLNFYTAYSVIQPLFTQMLQQNNGRIILIGSRPALKPTVGKNMIAYALSKSMLFQLAELLNETAKGKNVTVTVVAPSTIDTEANRKSMPDADTEKWVKPETLSELFEFILSAPAAVLRETVLKAYNNA